MGWRLNQSFSITESPRSLLVMQVKPEHGGQWVRRPVSLLVRLGLVVLSPPVSGKLSLLFSVHPGA
jgi:hypothetical protein